MSCSPVCTLGCNVPSLPDQKLGLQGNSLVHEKPPAHSSQAPHSNAALSQGPTPLLEPQKPHRHALKKPPPSPPGHSHRSCSDTNATAYSRLPPLLSVQATAALVQLVQAPQHQAQQHHCGGEQAGEQDEPRPLAAGHCFLHQCLCAHLRGQYSILLQFGKPGTESFDIPDLPDGVLKEPLLHVLQRLQFGTQVCAGVDVCGVRGPSVIEPSVHQV